jgi:hypothetical protein
MSAAIIARAEAKDRLSVLPWNAFADLARRRATYARLAARIVNYEELSVCAHGLYAYPTALFRIQFSDGGERFSGVIAEDRFSSCDCGLGVEVVMCVEGVSGRPVYIGAMTPLEGVCIEGILADPDFDPVVLRLKCQSHDDDLSERNRPAIAGRKQVLCYAKEKAPRLRGLTNHHH